MYIHKIVNEINNTSPDGGCKFVKQLCHAYVFDSFMNSTVKVFLKLNYNIKLMFRLYINNINNTAHIHQKINKITDNILKKVHTIYAIHNVFKNHRTGHMTSLHRL